MAEIELNKLNEDSLLTIFKYGIQTRLKILIEELAEEFRKKLNAELKNLVQKSTDDVIIELNTSRDMMSTTLQANVAITIVNKLGAEDE